MLRMEEVSWDGVAEIVLTIMLIAVIFAAAGLIHEKFIQKGDAHAKRRANLARTPGHRNRS